MERLKQHLIVEGHWSEKKHARLEEELKAEVTAAWKEAQQYGTMTEGPFLDPSTMFDDVYAETPRHLESQRKRMLQVEEGNNESIPAARGQRNAEGASFENAVTPDARGDNAAKGTP